MTSSKERLSISPRVLDDLSTPMQQGRRNSINDEAIWTRLHDAGFDEDSIKRRDKASLIAYIAKLEKEIFDYQHHMGLLLLEKKDWSSKYEQVKASTDSTEMKYKCDQAAHLSAKAEAKKNEESLQKRLAIGKACLENTEKALHELRAESAEIKITAESRMAEAHSVLENAQNKLVEAEAKTLAAESLQAEASRYHRTAERKLHEVEEREDDLRRRTMSFKTECDDKETQISFERQSLCERQKIVQQEQERLLDGQTLLNQREDYISGKHKELSGLERALEDSKSKIRKELRDLNEEKADLNLKLASLSTREEAVNKREAMLNKKEAELLCVQEKLAAKEHDEIQGLIAKHEAILQMKRFELEEEIEKKRLLVQGEMESKRRDCELREVDLCQREELVQEREQELDLHLKALLEKEKDITEKLNTLQEKEENLSAAKDATELEKIYMQEEKEQIKSMKVDLQKSIDNLENKRTEVAEAQEKLEATKHEKNELQVLEMRLTDEIESIRAQKLDLLTEVDDLKAEKSKFEIEWELIDEKRVELRREEERVFEERKAFSKFVKDERDRLKVEKEEHREQFKHDLESLSRERQVSASKMEQEQSEWFSKIELERANFVQDIELQKIELENRNRKRRDEIESYLKDKEESFEQEKTKELLYISSSKEMLAKEWENVESEMKRLENERIEITLDRDRREKELAELQMAVKELQIQREKLKEQRQLLHADSEKINIQIQHLSQLENLKIAPGNFVLSEIEEADYKFARRNLPVKKCLDLHTISNDGELELLSSKDAPNGLLTPNLLSKQAQDSASPPSSAAFSWLKEITGMIFRHSPEKPSLNHRERSPATEFEGAKLLEDKYSQEDNIVVLAQLENVQDKSDMIEQQISKAESRTHNIFGRVQPVKSASEEPKVILEVPLADENVQKACNLESETEIEVTGHALYADQGLLPGRKRGNSSPDSHDASLKQKRDKKKRRQGRYSPETSLEETTSNRAVSVSAEDNGFTSLDQTPRSPRGNGECVDESHRYVDDAKGTESFVKSVILDNSQHFSVASNQEYPKGGGIDAEPCPQRVVSGVSLL